MSFGNPQIISSSGSNLQPTASGPTPDQVGDVGALTLRATTGPNGFALVNGTPDIVRFQAPNDGQLHRAILFCRETVTTLETGGQVGWVLGPASAAIFAPGQAAGEILSSSLQFLVRPGELLHVQQFTALTGGAASVSAEIWAS